MERNPLEAISPGMATKAEFQARTNWVALLKSSDVSDQLLALSLMLGGPNAKAEFQELSEAHEKLRVAVESSEVVIVAKNEGDRQVVQAFIPLTYPDISFRFLSSSNNGSPDALTVKMEVDTSQSFRPYNDMLAHSMIWLGLHHRGSEVEAQERIRAFLRSDRDSIATFAGPPEDVASVWINFWAGLEEISGKDVISVDSSLSQSPLNGVYTPQEFLDEFASTNQTWQDQIEVLTMFATVYAQAAYGENKPHKEVQELIAASLTLNADQSQFGLHGNSISNALIADLQNLIDSLAELTPISALQAHAMQEAKAASEQDARLRAIEQMRQTARVEFEQPQTQIGDKVSETLAALYSLGQQQGYFIYEIQTPECFEARVGNQAALAKKGFAVSQITNIDSLARMNISVPGAGTSRELAVARALSSWHRLQTNEDLDLPGGNRTPWATVSADDLEIRISMPVIPERDLKFRAEVYRDGEEHPIEVFGVPIKDSPFLGISKRDQNAVIDEALSRLVSIEPSRVSAPNIGDSFVR